MKKRLFNALRHTIHEISVHLSAQSTRRMSTERSSCNTYPTASRS